MRIAFASAEVFPYAKTGGLGDVLGALPKVLKKQGIDVKVFLPKYATIDHSKYELDYCYPIGEMPIRVAGQVHNVNVFHSTLPDSDVDVYFLDCPHFYNRPSIYTNDRDEDERFIMLCKGVLESLQRLQWKPDVIHCNDWQTGLIPLYLKDNYSWDRFFDNVASVMTIHNIAYQGRFSKNTVEKAEIRPELFYQNSALEVWGNISFLKAGLMYADAINTVSYTYAHEITTSEFGAGLEGVLRHRINDFWGILNGVDYHVWNPATDKHLPFHFSLSDMSGKEANKKFLLESVHLPYRENVPLIGIVSRMVSQKGFDLIARGINELMQLDVQWVVLGTGEDEFEDLFRSLSYVYPQKVFSYIGFNNELSHLIEAAADIFLMPSYYEPCGLNQIYSLKYGTVPVVRKTGGLADTVKDWHELYYNGNYDGTGFTFNDYTPYALVSTMRRAVEAYYDKDLWNKIILNGMLKDFSWENSARTYKELYNHALKNKRG